MSRTLSGPDYIRPADEAPTLAGFLQSRLARLDHRIVEIDQAGTRHARPMAELRPVALALLARLQASGDPARSDVVVCCDSVMDFLPAVWACVLGGYSCLPWQLSKNPSERDIRPWAEAVRDGLKEPILIAGDGIRERIALSEASPFRAALAIDRAPGGPVSEALPPMRAGGPEEGAFLMLTSGTTGNPKIAIVGYQCILDRYYSAGEFRSPPARLFCFPFDSITGIAIALQTLADSVFVPAARLAAHPLTVVEAIEEFHLTSFVATSSIIARVLDGLAREPKEYDLSSLRHISFGAEPIVPHIIRGLGTRLRSMGAGNVTLSFGYGMTETGLIATTEKFTLNRVADRVAGDGPISVGGCTSGLSMRIVDDGGDAMPPASEGNVEVRSAAKLFSGYRNAPALTAESFSKDGWFKTGDRGFVEGNELRLTGRQKATIIINGKNYSLAAIEMPLRGMDGIRRGLVAAAAIRNKESPTDELAVFFVPADGVDIDGLCRTMTRETGRQWGVAIRHLVPLEESDFPLTPTGKIKLRELVERYASGKFQAHVLAEPAPARPGVTDVQAVLAELWQAALRLPTAPGPDDNFFDLGGDSLASAELVFAVEQRFSCRLPMEAFFQSPTIGNLAALLGRADRASPVSTAEHPADVMRRLQIYTGSWQGKRAFPDSLVVGMNTGGNRSPIFWVFQEYLELVQVARFFGPDQPVYGMRSCVRIVAVKDYTDEVVDSVCNRYLWEILALAGTRPFVLSGTCQGGILALTLARRLEQIGRRASLLVLTEWSYSRGAYAGPTLLVYNRDSTTADIFATGKRKTGWRKDFPHRRLIAVPGDHDNAFTDANVPYLVEAVRRQSDARFWLTGPSRRGQAAFR